MTTVNVQVKGLRELEAALDALPLKVGERAFSQALRAGIKPIQDAARELLVNQIREHTGNLVNSLKVRIVKAKGSSDPTQAEALLTVGDKVAYYANWIEFGTQAHLIHALPGHALKIASLGYAEQAAVPGIIPRAFMRPAFDTKGLEAIDLFAEDLREFIEMANW